MYFINQIVNDDCAFASLKILLANLKHNENYLYLKQDEKHGSFSYLELIDIAKHYGTELIGFKVDEKEELRHADIFPMILTIKVNENSHAVCLMAINKKYATLLDPSSGKVKMKITKLFEIWDGTGLLIKEEKECKENPVTPIKKARNNVLDYIFQFLAGASFLFGLVTMSYENFTLFSFISIGVAVIFEVLSRLVKIREMKRFDRNISYFIEKVEPKNLDHFIVRKEKYKESIFSNKNNFFYYLFISFFIVFTIVIGNPKNVICVLLPIALALIQTQILNHKEKESNAELEILEVKFSLSKSPLKAKRLYDEIHAKSYKFASSIFIKKCIGIVLFGLSAGLSLYLLNSLNIINFLFLLFTEVYLYQNLNSLLSYENGIKEKKINFMRFINVL